MSIHRFLSLCLGLSVLVLFGCSSNIVDPGSSTQQEQLGSSSHALNRDGNSDLASCYFPLHDGDRWVYQLTSSSSHDLGGAGQLEEVSVTGNYQMQGQRVFQLDNYLFPLSGSGIDFYNAQPGQTTEASGEDIGLWYPWCEFGGEGVPIELPEFVDDCVHGSTGMQMGLDIVTVPAGTFHRVAIILYDSTPCADNGLAREVFAPGVGLIERTTTTFEGQETWKLIYASVGGQEWGTPPEE